MPQDAFLRSASLSLVVIVLLSCVVHYFPAAFHVVVFLGSSRTDCRSRTSNRVHFKSWCAPTTASKKTNSSAPFTYRSPRLTGIDPTARPGTGCKLCTFCKHHVSPRPIGWSGTTTGTTLDTFIGSTGVNFSAEINKEGFHFLRCLEIAACALA